MTPNVSFNGVEASHDSDSQAANDDLLRMFFDKPEFKEALTAWARREVYRKITDDLGGAA